MFVAVDTATRYYTSSNGITWNSTVLKISNNKSFIAIANNSSPYVMTSNDGRTWNSGTSIPSGSWRSIAFGNGTFVVVSADAKILVSFDAG